MGGYHCIDDCPAYVHRRLETPALVTAYDINQTYGNISLHRWQQSLAEIIITVRSPLARYDAAST